MSIAFGWKDQIGLVDALGIQISPATEQKQDDIISAINGISGGGATSIGTGSKTVTTAGTRVQLATTTSCRRVHIQAKEANTGKIFIGGNAVSSTSGIFLFPTTSITLNISDLDEVYIDSEVNGEGVIFTYEI